MSRTPHPAPEHHLPPARSSNGILLIILGGVLVITGGTAVVVMMNNRGPQPAAQQPPPPGPTPAPAARPSTDDTPTLVAAKKVLPKADQAVTADGLIDAFTRAEDVATAQTPPPAPATAPTTAPEDDSSEPSSRPFVLKEAGFKGKVLDITGRVYGKFDSDLVGHSIALGGGVERIRGVRCNLSPENIEQLASIAKGQTIVIRGRCTDLVKDIEIVDCAVLKIVSAE